MTFPLRDGSPFAVHLQHATGSAVVCLVNVGDPSAIVRRVMAVVIGAVDAVLRGGPRPHVSKKRGEALAPLVAHGDTASAVVGKGALIRVVAAAFDRRPGAVFVGAAVSMCGGYALASQTPTAFDATGQQSVAIGNDFATTRTRAADAETITPSTGYLCHGCESAEGAAGHWLRGDGHSSLSATTLARTTVYTHGRRAI